MITSRPCWTIVGVNYALPFEAGAVPDELFRVAHVPGIITRYRFRGHGSGRGEGQQVNEEQVLDDLLHGEAAMRVAAITGEVGTGKSHLVRWLHIELNRRRKQSPDLEHLHIVYVPKTKTTLRRVVERILDRQHGPRFDEFRQRLQRAQDSFNHETAPDRLVDELANSIRDLAHEDLVEPDAYRALLIEELPTLIQDPVYRQALLGDGSVIRRTIDNALERSGASEDGLARFAEADLHLELADLTDMSPKARETFGRLAGPRFRTPALALMNDQIDRAVGALFDVRRGEVGELLVDVRAELQEQQRELVLLIEDFTLLQGVERELLEAVIAPVQEVDGRRLCPVRAAFAVTTGHFELMGTVISRVDADGGYRYSLDADFDSETGPKATLDDAVTLVGSYLNAARLGQSTVESWSREHLDDDSEPPNACDQCELVDDCHRGFGTSRLGHGLYPFNRSALGRILRGQGATTFEPRELLKHVRETLRDERTAIESGTFPTPSWARKHNPALTPMTRKVLDDLREAHGSDERAAQAEHLLMFWAGVTDRVVNLDPDIHEAFGIAEIDGAPALDGEVGPEPPPGPEPEEGKPPPPPPPPQDPLEAEQDAIAGWRTALRSGTVRERELPAPLAREVRQQFAEIALERASVGLRFLAYDPRETAALLRDGIYIEGAAGGNPRTEGAIVVRLDAEDEALILALRRLHHGRELSVHEFVAITEGIDGHLDEVVNWLANHRAPEDRFVAALQLLYLAAAATDPRLGRDKPSDDSVMSALFSRPFSGLATRDLPKRRAFESAVLDPSAITEATQIIESASSVRQSVTRGGPAGIDAATVLSHIDALRESDLKVRTSRVRTGPGAVLTQASALLDTVLDEGSDVLQASLERIQDLLGDDGDTTSIAEECGLAVDALMNANAFGADATRMRSAARAFAEIELGALRGAAAAALDDDQSRDERLRRMSRVQWNDVEAADSFLKLADDAIAASAERLASSTRNGFDTLGQLKAARAAGSELADTFDRFADGEERVV